MAGVELPGGRTLTGSHVDDESVPEIPRVAWEATGGSAPSIGGADLGSGAAPADLGSGAVRLSTFGQIGVECDATCWIVMGSGSSGPTGAWTVLGLPVQPLQDAVNVGRIIGHGWILDASEAYRVWDVVVMSDAVYGGPPSMIVPRDIDGVPNTLGDRSGVVHDDNPLDLGEGDIINLTLRYEADLS